MKLFESSKMKRALLVIDVQNEYFTGKLPVTYPVMSFNNIKETLDIANEKDIPVILVQHSSPSPDAMTFKKHSEAWEIHPDIQSRKHSLIIEKSVPGSFTNTNLEEWLKEHGITTLTICGYMTQMCCDTTARQAFHLGFNVEFLSDATGTLDINNYAGAIKAIDLHNAILITQAMRFSKVMTTREWIDSL